MGGWVCEKVVCTGAERGGCMYGGCLCLLNEDKEEERGPLFYTHFETTSFSGNRKAGTRCGNTVLSHIIEGERGRLDDTENVRYLIG